MSGSRVPRTSPVAFDALLESVHDGILVTGTLTASWEGACRRCLETATGEIVVTVRELCVAAGDRETTYELDGDELDLEPIAHDACILELPIAPLCEEGCLGLCPECGANRNLDQCSCASPPDPRWAALSLVSDGAPQARSTKRAPRPATSPSETSE